MNEDEQGGGSEPCFAHMVVDGHVVDPDTARDVARFRKSERQRLYALRKAVPLEQRKHMAAVVADGLDREIAEVEGAVIAVYWPIRGELDLRGWMNEVHLQGATVALPVVVERDQPVAFHRWSPDSTMRRGIWGIPVPETVHSVEPDIIVIPLLGVDENRFRLGNGGGYYDRTLARMRSGTICIGVGHDFSKLKTIFPMPWDIPMHRVILSDGIVW
uniref:5-formyltetrahydrofolate cyclo-ligase n=1 Tax=Pararhizobium sp. IMCC3301 TaxID=3067904 RepID=UPI0027425A74|nr:5-formyltetrahydrofolate cyclo-ligase [Pararhizobium sp. IMCC3301]